MPNGESSSSLSPPKRAKVSWLCSQCTVGFIVPAIKYEQTKKGGKVETLVKNLRFFVCPACKSRFPKEGTYTKRVMSYMKNQWYDDCYKITNVVQGGKRNS